MAGAAWSRLDAAGLLSWLFVPLLLPQCARVPPLHTLPPLAVRGLGFCPPVGVEQDLAALIRLPSWEARPCGLLGAVFSFPLVALKKAEMSKCYFLAYDVNFQERSGEFPTEFITNYYEDLGVTIVMSHL